eukprot:1896205-Rhodomonas_salina.1
MSNKRWAGGSKDQTLEFDKPPPTVAEVDEDDGVNAFSEQLHSHKPKQTDRDYPRSVFNCADEHTRNDGDDDMSVLVMVAMLTFAAQSIQQGPGQLSVAALGRDGGIFCSLSCSNSSTVALAFLLLITQSLTNTVSVSPPDTHIRCPSFLQGDTDGSGELAMCAGTLDPGDFRHRLLTPSAKAMTDTACCFQSARASTLLASSCLSQYSPTLPSPRSLSSTTAAFLPHLPSFLPPVLLLSFFPPPPLLWQLEGPVMTKLADAPVWATAIGQVTLQPCSINHKEPHS